MFKKFPCYILLLLFISTSSFAQEKAYHCENKAYLLLEILVGDWNVKTKDRISPGNYESNTGKAIIDDLINGCGIRETFRGTYKNNPYAREVMIIGKDTSGIEMSILDSEHSSFSIQKGQIKNNIMETYWYRDPEVRKLQSKYILTIKSQNQFEFSSYLSTDYGKNWALTHERIYTRN